MAGDRTRQRLRERSPQYVASRDRARKLKPGPLLRLLAVALVAGTGARDAGGETDRPSPSPAHFHHVLRGGLPRFAGLAAAGGPVRVVFLGGSITFNPGWRDLVGDDLRRRFLDASFEFVNAGIPSTGSTPGAFRFERDALAGGRVDLLFVEAAVNDSTNGRSDAEQIRGMEGIVRRAIRSNALADVAMLHFVDPEKMADYRAGRTPAVVRNHEAVAEHYGIPSIDLARETTERIDAGEFSWEEDFKDLHPSEFGQGVYFRSIRAFLDATLGAGGRADPRSLPEPLDPHSYSNARLAPPDAAEQGEGWSLDPQWVPRDGAGTRAGFVGVPALVAEAGAGEATFRFEGTAVGVFVAAGPDAGILEYALDDGAWTSRDLFTRWSAGLHLPWLHVLEAELAPGPHRLRIRPSAARNPASLGGAVRVFHFAVNAPEK